MASRKINQRILERLEAFTPQQRREALARLEEFVPPETRPARRDPPGRPRRRKRPGEVFWERLINEGLYDGEGRRRD